MLIGVLLFLSWLVLLLRYPNRALPISLVALAGLGMVASWVIWQDSIEARRLTHVQVQLRYAPDQCPADRPLQVTLENGSDAALTILRWDVAAYRPGETINLVRQRYESPRYRGPEALLPGKRWQDCLPLPDLATGYRPSTLEFRAERLQGHFSPL